jgi:hypothetical protein
MKYGMCMPRMIGKKYYGRLVNRMMATWTLEKTRLCSSPTGHGADGDANNGWAYQDAIQKIKYNDIPNGRLIECCHTYADLIIKNLAKIRLPLLFLNNEEGKNRCLRSTY